jgi:hypothetical protein
MWISKLYVFWLSCCIVFYKLYSAVQNLPDHQQITLYLEPMNTVDDNDNDDDDYDETHL